MFMLVLAGIGRTDEHFPFTGEIARGPVNVRAGANINFEAVDKLSQGAQVTVLGKSYDWYKIQLRPVAPAFIRADYVKVKDKTTGEVTADKVNVRARADSESSTLGQVDKGDTVKLVEQINGWWKVVPPEKTAGWVHQDFLRPAPQPQ